MMRDVQRHLADEPVVARAPSRLYRLQKLVRRNQGVFTAVAGLTGILLAGTVVSTYEAVRAGRAEFEQARLRLLAEADKRKAEGQ